MNAPAFSPAPWAYEYSPYQGRNGEIPAFEIFDADGNYSVQLTNPADSGASTASWGTYDVDEEGVLFILALRGLSSPATSRQGNRFGMIGMGIAVLTTLALRPPSSFFAWFLVILGFAIGGARTDSI